MVDIIPKQETIYSSWQKVAWYGSLVLTVFGAAAFAFLFLADNSAKSKLQETKADLTREETAEEASLEASIFGTQKRIEDYSSLRNQRKDLLKVFEFIESITLPETSFGQLGFDSKDAKVVMPGTSKNFKTLAQQFEVLKQSKDISGLNLFNISVGQEGVGFSIEFTLNSL